MPYVLFGLFALTLLGIATMHRFALRFAVAGMLTVLVVRLLYSYFLPDGDPMHFNLLVHMLGGMEGGHEHEGEWKILLNLAGLLVGFAVLAAYFEGSKMPEKLTEVLPGGKTGAFLLLLLVAVLSAILDNIASALIGGSAALVLFKGRVHIGYLAAIVAASNAGGAGSVVGDTTTTMIWLDGVSPLDVVEAAVGAVAALAFFGYFAASQQHHLQPLQKAEGVRAKVDVPQLAIVGLILAGAIFANIKFDFPAGGVWAAILLGCLVRKAEWHVVPGAVKGMVFLLSLVTCASMMPVESLPSASWQTALGLGVVSAFFDNIPLTKLAIDQGGYDWGFLAYAVGFGGSMLWFGSSAGVALSNIFPQAKSAGNWVKGGWHVIVGYFIGFTVMMLALGWHPHAPHKNTGSAVEHGATVEQGAVGTPGEHIPPTQPGR